MKFGVYQHYKGPKYLVLGVAHDANADEREVVVYVGLERGDKEGTPMAVRTVEDFNQKLCGISVGNVRNNGWHTCALPLDERDRCPTHEHTNTPPVRRFTCLERD